MVHSDDDGKHNVVGAVTVAEVKKKYLGGNGGNRVGFQCFLVVTGNESVSYYQ